MKTLQFGVGLIFALVGVAHADISDSGNLTIGGQGIFIGTVTVQGNAFSVGASTLAVTGGKVGIATNVPSTSLDVNGSAQFGSGAVKSTFTASPGNANFALELSSGIRFGAGGIRWADGTISTTAAAGGGGVAASTFTRLTSEQTTTSTSWVSITGSTLTLTMGGRRALIGFSCQFGISSTGCCGAMGVLLNGGFIDGESSGGVDADGGFNRHCSAAANRDEMGGFVHLTENTYSGGTSFSLVWKVDCGTGRLNHAAKSVCQLFVTEQ